MRQKKTHPRTLLATAGLKVTPARVAVIETFLRADEPLAIQNILQRIQGRDVNQATVYRVVEALETIGIIRRVDFQHDHAHYELASDDDHHHVICRTCGAVENIMIDDGKLLKNVLRKSKIFRSIAHHSLEFYGVCKNCAKKSS